jgi:hypothetical protein
VRELFVHLSEFVRCVATCIVIESANVNNLKRRYASSKLNISQVSRTAPATELNKSVDIVFSESVGREGFGVPFSSTLKSRGQQESIFEIVTVEVAADVIDKFLRQFFHDARTYR